MTTKTKSLEYLTDIKRSRKVGNNTFRVEYQDGTVAIRLHTTDVVTFKTDGTTVLNSGGWQTSTTKSRINTYIPKGYYLYQRNYCWYVGKRDVDNQVICEVDFKDGMSLPISEL